METSTDVVESMQFASLFSGDFDDVVLRLNEYAKRRPKVHGPVQWEGHIDVVFNEQIDKMTSVFRIEVDKLKEKWTEEHKEAIRRSLGCSWPDEGEHNGEMKKEKKLYFTLAVIPSFNFP